uniref:Uncharacterized protein n=1 Tax=Kalanchoe fedtschenkoi TaxID=63787 RepID=A0A7N0RHH0_KALFE
MKYRQHNWAGPSLHLGPFFVPESSARRPRPFLCSDRVVSCETRKMEKGGGGVKKMASACDVEALKKCLEELRQVSSPYSSLQVFLLHRQQLLALDPTTWC